MGRGRAKAKQTKVARELKYRSIDTDFTSLERELRGAGNGYDTPPVDEQEVPSGYEDLADRYGDYPDDTDDDTDDGYGDLRKSG